MSFPAGLLMWHKWTLYLYICYRQSPSLGLFFFHQLCLRFQPKEKIVNCVMSKETSWNNLSVCRAVCCFSTSSLWSDNQSIQTYEEICWSINAMVNDWFTWWSDIILAVYPSLSLSDQPASCSSAPAGWQQS